MASPFDLQMRLSGQALEEGPWLAAIVDWSDDAILSKTLDGVIMSWNAAAERLFGYTAEEAIGQHVTIIIPADRLGEEEAILSKLRRGEAIRNFETVRRRKDGTLVDISLTVSPVRDSRGAILGASKIARDISDAKLRAERQDLMLREINHRVKNLFTVISGLLALSARDATCVDTLVDGFAARIRALDRAHSLTMPDIGPARQPHETHLAELLATVIAPYDEGQGKVSIQVEQDVGVGPRALPMLALIVHELATNAAKYGALAQQDGRLEMNVTGDESSITLQWIEHGVTGRVESIDGLQEGFGSQLLRVAARGLGGNLAREWTADGVVATLRVPRRTFSA